MAQRCPAVMKSGEICHRPVKKKYGKYCGIHKSEYYIQREKNELSELNKRMTKVENESKTHDKQLSKVEGKIKEGEKRVSMLESGFQVIQRTFIKAVNIFVPARDRFMLENKKRRALTVERKRNA